MGTQSLWYYREPLFRIIEESLEVSLVICNAELSEFTVAKIFDIFNQILPTGFVLNTGYWPFFNSLKKQSICVCGRYGLDCRHYKHDYHWIDLEALSSDQTMSFSTRSATLTLLNSQIELTPITGGTAGYTLNIKLTFQYKKIERGRPRRKKDENFNINPDQLVHVVICSRYIIQREYYPALHTIMFRPSPFFYETYGTYFSKLLEAREALIQYPTEINQHSYTVSMENMPHFTLLLQFVNMPVYIYARTVIQAHLANLAIPKVKKMTFNKGTQTDVADSAELWKYRELIDNLKPLWNDSQSPYVDSLCVDRPRHPDFRWGTYVVNDLNLTNRCSITEIPSGTESDKTDDNNIDDFNDILSTIKKEINDDIICEDELPSSTTQDREYDTQWPQWGYQQAVAKKRGRKRHQSIQTIGDTLADSRRRYSSLGLGTDRLKGSKWIPSYATILKTPKPPQLTIEYNVDKTMEPYKEDPSFHWFNTQFPDLSKPNAIKEELIEEDFNIAEEFINQEKQRENLRWRLKQIQ